MYTGQFSLSGSLSISGLYTLYLTKKGADKAQYDDSAMISVTLLASSSPLPSPVMVVSQFTDSGQNVMITFNAPTDQAGKQGPFACNFLFDFTGASQTTCTWVNSSVVSVSFGVYTDTITYLAIGESVSLRSSLLKAFCSVTSTSCNSNLLSPRQTVINLQPSNPVRPVVIVSAPTALGSCANLSLDATGSYGSGSRPYNKILWHVSAVIYGPPDTAVNVSDIQTYLNAYSTLYQVSRPFKISAQSLTKATYTLTLTLTNFLGLTSFASVILNVVSDPNIPTLSVIGSSYLQISAATTLNVFSAVKLSICATSRTKILYTWRLFNVKTGFQSALVSTSLDPSKYSLPPYSLDVGSTYTLTITAKAGISSTSAAPVTIFVSSGLVTAAVVGGYIRSAHDTIMH
jgi:hypothetical protein